MKFGMGNVLVRCEQVVKSFKMGASELTVLQGIDLEIEKGEAVCIRGASGSGKSTLLHLLGALDRPNSGFVSYEDVDYQKKTDEELALLRNQKMGFVFQFHHLLQEFSALENVMMPCRLAGESTREARLKAEAVLDEVGLKDRAEHLPSELSGGESQRVAIARALVQKPALLFADEPTGNLDFQTGRKIQSLFFDLHERRNVTLVVVTHDQDFARRFKQQYFLRDGKFVPEFGVEKP